MRNIPTRPLFFPLSRLTVLTICLGMLMFVIDVLTPLGVAVPVLYVGLIVIATWSPHPRFTVMSAGGFTALTVAGFFLSPSQGEIWVAATNRALVIFVIWATAILSLSHKRQEEEARTLRGLLPICATCKKIRDDKGYWQRLEKYMEDHSAAQFSHSICDDCLIKAYPELQAEITAPNQGKK